jgi:hypothetical protein
MDPYDRDAGPEFRQRVISPYVPYLAALVFAGIALALMANSWRSARIDELSAAPVALPGATIDAALTRELARSSSGRARPA